MRGEGAHAEAVHPPYRGGVEGVKPPNTYVEVRGKLRDMLGDLEEDEFLFCVEVSSCFSF